VDYLDAEGFCELTVNDKRKNGSATPVANRCREQTDWHRRRGAIECVEWAFYHAGGNLEKPAVVYDLSGVIDVECLSEGPPGQVNRLEKCERSSRPGNVQNHTSREGERAEHAVDTKTLLAC
jgi:hypothetical protein